jgi:uncharacterized membrane protein YfcA
MQRLLLFFLALTFLVGIGFIAVILANLAGGVALHEAAALVLVVLLLLSLGASHRLRAINKRPESRVVIALTALVVAAVTGASLATGTVSLALARLPLLPLVAMLVAVADGIRVTRHPSRRLLASQTERSHTEGR